MIASGDQNKFLSSFAPLGDLLKALMTLTLHRQIKSLLNEKVLPRCGRKMASSDSITFLLLSSLFCFCITCVFCFYFESLQFLCFALSNMFLRGYFSVLLCFVFHIIKKLKNQKNTKTVCVLCTLVLVYLGWPLK